MRENEELATIRVNRKGANTRSGGALNQEALRPQLWHKQPCAPTCLGDKEER